MEALFGYYAAADDRDARQAVMSEDGQAIGAGYDQILVNGIDPVADLSWLEFVLTGRSPRLIKSDPRLGHIVAEVGNGEVVSVSLTDTLRDGLVGVDRGFMDDIAPNWRLSGSYPPPADAAQLAVFLKQLAALAERAITRGHSLYCWKHR
ncbi:hypothetical protein ACFCXT_39440 [Streptomyces vinaceus]|uniref:hypothetical protein n=1 Tax=Streptomyces vinaceus TaxID=1960 RepID=UPI0035DB92BA